MIHSINSNITFEQLVTFVAIVEQNGVNAAADSLFKSPSTVSHTLKKLQETLDIKLFIPDGRQLKLTAEGSVLLKHAQELLQEKEAFIHTAQQLKAGQRNQLSIAFDNILPYSILANAMTIFSKDYPNCKITLNEGVLSGVEERLLQGKADITINYRATQGFLVEQLLSIVFVPVASNEHPLAREPSISSKQLSNHRQVVISDSGINKQIDSGWLKAKQRWSVSSIQTAKEVIKSGKAFGWIPKHVIEQELSDKTLIPLNLSFGKLKEGSLYLIITDDNCEVIKAMANTILQCSKEYNR